MHRFPSRISWAKRKRLQLMQSPQLDLRWGELLLKVARLCLVARLSARARHAGTSVVSGSVVTLIVSAGPSAGGGLTLPVLTPLPASETTPPVQGVSATAGQSYVVMAWNELGMHCLNPSYDTAVILPPYNNVRAQVIRRGNKPAVITAGVTVYVPDNQQYHLSEGTLHTVLDVCPAVVRCCTCNRQRLESG